MRRIRVLVVEDSITVRKRLIEVLAADPDLELVGEAADGRQAIELCRRDRPDVITMDMMLPVMSGLAATEYIMAHCPTPILVVSASLNRGELFRTYEALAAGAVDVMEKPTGAEPDGAWEQRLLAAVKLVARIRVVTHPRARLSELSRQPVAQPRPVQSAPEPARGCGVVAIGASTGGPAAIVQVLRGLPSGFAPPILFVQHIDEPFGIAFAEWLNGQTNRRVAHAEDGAPLAAAAGRVVMAPPGRHLVLREGRLRLTVDPARHFCRPSVDVLFESVARACGPTAVACLLTGMGRDGAVGLRTVRQAGGRTIAQDEATSIVYGMPREAALLDAAERILPLGEIGSALAALALAQWKTEA